MTVPEHSPLFRPPKEERELNQDATYDLSQEELWSLPPSQDLVYARGLTQGILDAIDRTVHSEGWRERLGEDRFIQFAIKELRQLCEQPRVLEMLLEAHRSGRIAGKNQDFLYQNIIKHDKGKRLEALDPLLSTAESCLYNLVPSTPGASEFRSKIIALVMHPEIITEVMIKLSRENRRFLPCANAIRAYGDNSGQVFIRQLFQNLLAHRAGLESRRDSLWFVARALDPKNPETLSSCLEVLRYRPAGQAKLHHEALTILHEGSSSPSLPQELFAFLFRIPPSYPKLLQQTLELIKETASEADLQALSRIVTGPKVALAWRLASAQKNGLFSQVGFFLTLLTSERRILTTFQKELHSLSDPPSPGKTKRKWL